MRDLMSHYIKSKLNSTRHDFKKQYSTRTNLELISLYVSPRHFYAIYFDIKSAFDLI